MDETPNNNDPSSSNKKRSKRGRSSTTCKTVKKKCANKDIKKTIDFDENGFAIGDWATHYRSYVGSVARAHIDIRIPRWDLVDPVRKNLAWLDIKKEFNIEDDKKKDNVLKGVHKQWKDFKSRLTSRFIYSNPPRNPLEVYTDLDPEEWEGFKKSRLTDEFKEQRKKAQECQSFNEHPHLLGPSGYAGKRPLWIARDPSYLASSSTTSDTRANDWVLGRSKLNDKGELIQPNEKTREVVKKMDQLRQEQAEGKWTPYRHDDLLSRALGKPEHGGFLKAVGGKPTITSYYGKEERKGRRGVVSLADLAEILTTYRNFTMAEVASMLQVMSDQNFQKTKNLMKAAGLSLEDEDEVDMSPPKNQPKSSCHSTDPNLESNLEEDARCLLCVKTLESDEEVVASGTIFKSKPGSENVVHFQQILPDHVRVSVDSIEPAHRYTPLPVPTQYHTLVGEVEGGFVQWPRDLVRFPEDSTRVKEKKSARKQHEKREKAKRKEPPTTKASGTKGKGKSSLGVDPLLEGLNDSGRSLYCAMLALPPEMRNTVEVEPPDELFLYPPDIGGSIYVTLDDVKQLLSMAWLNISILQIFMMYLHKECTRLKVETIGFMCPQLISSVLLKNPESATQYMRKVFAESSSKRFILAPYFQDDHWILIVINCGQNAVYILDPMASHERRLHVMGPLKMSLRANGYVGKQKSKLSGQLKWIPVECPQQEGGVECGYYVMRYMFEIATLYYNNEDLTESLGRSPYTQEQIDEVRDLWADYFVYDCI